MDLETYRSYGGHFVHRVETNDSQVLYLADYYYMLSFQQYPEVVLYETPIFKTPIRLTHKVKSDISIIPVHYTVQWARHLIIAFFLFPISIFLFRKNNTWFVFVYYSSILISSSLILYFVFSGKNIFNIFTLLMYT